MCFSFNTTLALLTYIFNDCAHYQHSHKSDPPGFCDQIFKILRQFLLNSAEVFVRYFSTQTSKIYTNSYKFEKFCKIE